EVVQVKAAGGVRDLGATRCGATATAAILKEFRVRERAGG
ncbi:MAG: deoxyribose-phosphate aldolase, partial [Limisphaerales bacterium]